MIQIAGIVNSHTSEDERTNIIVDALSSQKSSCKIVHPCKSMTLGWTSTSRLVAFERDNDKFAFVYGSAYSTSSTDAIVSVDAPGEFARLLLRTGCNLNISKLGVHGSYIAITGDRSGQFIICGDPEGNRGPYYTWNEKLLLFANHPLACARLNKRPEVDRGLEDFLLIYGFLPYGRTVYRDVRSLSKSNAIVSVGQGCSVVHNKQRSVQSSTEIVVPESEEALYDRLYELLLMCVKEQLPAARDIGVLLGGFDSALVAALLHKLGKKVHTYSFYYSDNSYNQPHVHTLARFLGCNHYWVHITPDVISKGINDYAKHYVQPSNWLNYLIQTTRACEEMRRNGIEYAYSGDGCDAMFLGYPGTYKRTSYFSRLPRLPSSLVSSLVYVLSQPLLDRSIGHPYRVAMNMLRAMSKPMPERAFLTFRIMDETTVYALRQGQEPDQDESTEDIVQNLAQPYAGSTIQRLGYISKSLISPNRAKLLAASDAAGVVVHSPYLHPALREFVAMVPDDMLRRQEQNSLADPGKVCLMRMAERHGLLPSEIIYQPKLAAIDAPIDAWFEAELRTSMSQALAGLPFEPDPRQLDAFIYRTVAERLYRRYIGSTRVISDAISLLVTYGAICGALSNRDI